MAGKPSCVTISHRTKRKGCFMNVQSKTRKPSTSRREFLKQTSGALAGAGRDTPRGAPAEAADDQERRRVLSTHRTRRGL